MIIVNDVLTKCAVTHLFIHAVDSFFSQSMLSELQMLLEAKEEENKETLKKLDEQLEEREKHTEYLQNKIAQLQQNLQLLR